MTPARMTPVLRNPKAAADLVDWGPVPDMIEELKGSDPFIDDYCFITVY